ncbi:MAG: MFS transporter [Pseudomonadota bacterium]
MNKRIFGWYFFDWASQPYHTVLLTFVFGPFFAATATQYFAGAGLEEQAADARAQSLWSFTLTIAGLIVAFAAPILGALADATGRRKVWVGVFSLFCVLGASSLWVTEPDGSNLTFALFVFGVGFVAVEFAQIFVNSQLPGLGPREDIGRVSGSGFSFGYLGGFIALLASLGLLVEQVSGATVFGLPPGFGLLDAGASEGTRAVGPFVALWFAVFMIPYFLWVKEDRSNSRATFSDGLARLGTTIRGLASRPSLASFLGGSMLYRDALNGLYAFGGTYAALVLDWSVSQVGVFGIIAVIAAAAFSFVGGRLDKRFGPKPVVTVSLIALIVVCLVIVWFDRVPDSLFMVCGVLIGGFGGIAQAASRTLMSHHSEVGSETQSFGLYGLAGRATSFLAPFLIGAVTVATGSVQNGVLPLILLFLLGLLLLRWTKPEGDRADQWSELSSPSS